MKMTAVLNGAADIQSPLPAASIATYFFTREGLVDELEILATKCDLKLRRFLRKFERDPHLIEDLVQETFVEAIRSVGSYQGRSKPETWLFGIALNIARGHRARMAANRNVCVSLDDIEASSFDEPQTESLIDRVIAREMISQMGRRLESMSRDLVKTFECVCVNGMRYQEAADELNVPVGTIRSRIFRIRELLQN